MKVNTLSLTVGHKVKIQYLKESKLSNSAPNIICIYMIFYSNKGKGVNVVEEYLMCYNCLCL